jgi:hypothetical protein
MFEVMTNSIKLIEIGGKLICFVNYFRIGKLQYYLLNNIIRSNFKGALIMLSK